MDLPGYYYGSSYAPPQQQQQQQPPAPYTSAAPPDSSYPYGVPMPPVQQTQQPYTQPQQSPSQFMPSRYSPTTSPPPAPQSTSSSQETRQRLTVMLGHGRHGGLPYDESFKHDIREQLALAMEHYPSLKAQPASFTHNDGRTATLLQLEGTIPVWYKGGKYNIPICMWLLEPFPQTPPLVYVTPTRDMIIRPRHAHVDPSGLVDVPYLRDWVAGRSHILDLIQILCVVFGHETPLYSCQQPQPQQQPLRRPSTAAGPLGSPSPAAQPRALPSGFLGGSSPAQPPAPGTGDSSPVKSSQYLGSTRSSPSSSFATTEGGKGDNYINGWGTFGSHMRPAGDSASTASKAATLTQQAPLPKVDVGDVFRRNAVSALTSRLERDVTESCQDASRKVDSLLGVQQLLRERRRVVETEVQELQQEKGQLEQALQACLTQANALDTWLSANNRGPTDLDPDAIFEPADALSRQLLDCVSSDLAIEDTMYALDRALQDGTGTGVGRHGPGGSPFPVDVYLKEVRSLAREQFTFRALELKIRAAQRSARVSQMAAAAPLSAKPYPMPPAQGGIGYPRV